MPYPRYGETPEATLAALQAMQEPLQRGPRPAGLAGRHAGRRRPQRAGLRAVGSRGQAQRPARLEPARPPAPQPCTTAYTISLGTPEAMAAATAKAAHRPLLKIKLGGDGDGARIAAVRKAAPESELIVDANEAWTAAQSARKISPPAPRPASRWWSSRCPPARMTRWRGSSAADRGLRRRERA